MGDRRRAEKAHNAMGQEGINCRESGGRKLRIWRTAFELELPAARLTSECSQLGWIFSEYIVRKYSGKLTMN